VATQVSAQSSCDGLSLGVVVRDDELSDVLRDLRDDGVTEATQLTHSLGNPMSHATHCGFNAPVVCGSPVNAFGSRPELRMPVALVLDASGVGSSVTSVLRGRLFRFIWLAPPVFEASCTVGVGHNEA
jgi:hypothetical protein